MRVIAALILDFVDGEAVLIGCEACGIAGRSFSSVIHQGNNDKDE